MHENKATPQCFKVIVENMIQPVAVFLYKEHADAWKNETYGHQAIVEECQDASLLCSALHQDYNNLAHQPRLRNGCTG